MTQEIYSSKQSRSEKQYFSMNKLKGIVDSVIIIMGLYYVSLYILAALGSLLPPPPPIPGQTMVTLRIEKIGLKDASQYIDPYITITVKGKIHLKDASQYIDPYITITVKGKICLKEPHNRLILTSL